VQLKTSDVSYAGGLHGVNLLQFIGNSLRSWTFQSFLYTASCCTLPLISVGVFLCEHALALGMKALRRALLLLALPNIAALFQQPFCSTRTLQHAKQSKALLAAQDDADQRASKKHHSAAAVFRLVRGKARLFTKYGRAR
jgi:hypothetical protein